MDQVEYTNLAEAFAAVPDPRDARGKRSPWSLLLVLISAALVSGQPHGLAISQWVREHRETLCRAIGWSRAHWPSEATLRRVVRAVDVDALERSLRQVALQATAATGALVGQSIDGKTVRGALAHDQWVHLVGLVRHDGAVLAQVAVADKANEIAAAPLLVAGRDLTGMVMTMDALLTHRTFAAQIRQQGGHDLMVAKENQPELAAAIATLFDDPPWLSDEREREYAVAQTVEKGHGRLETRTLEASPSLNDWLELPDVGQVLRRTWRRVNQRTGLVEESVMLGLTSVPFDARCVEQIEGYWRGHWGIENRVHDVRDETLRDDRGQAHAGATANALAVLRNGILTQLRRHGWTNIADALRHDNAAPRRALALIGVTMTGL